MPSGQNSLLDKVEPGSTEDSYLWHKINGTQVEAGGSGLTMPKDNPPLTPQQMAIIEIWILSGAPNN